MRYLLVVLIMICIGAVFFHSHKPDLRILVLTKPLYLFGGVGNKGVLEFSQILYRKSFKIGA